MPAQESKATANLRRNAAKTAEQMRRLVAQAVREAKAAIDAGLKAKAALTAAGRAPIEAQIDVAFRQKLQTKLQEALDALSSKSAASGNEEAIRQAEAKGEIIPRFSPEYLHAYLARISPKNAPALAAVFTQSMSASAKEALRLAAVDTFRAAAATGLTTRERMKLLQENWARRAQDTNPFRFVDRAGRRWENARYVQMLARTTAQRVQTAAFCDSMLQGGYPLAVISNDSGDLQCGVCSAWEGRLIDLTVGNLFKKYGAVPLRAAREAGVFHPNCTHRLEYLSPTEYPKGAWDEFADRVGEPGAFGDPLKTNAGLESKAAAKRRAEEAAKAAEERAKREAEEAARREQAKSPIGKTGTWDELKLGRLEKEKAKPSKGLITPEEALAILHNGKIISDVFGQELHIGELARHHIVEAKRRSQQEIGQRLSNLNNVIETIRDPLEVWKDEKKPYTTYISIVESEDSGKQVVHAVILKGKRVYSWHLNGRELNHGRSGTLLYRKKEKRQGGEPPGAR